jgi:fructosamine-3-kinase
MNSPLAAVEAALGRRFGQPVPIARRTPLGGGSINRTERIATPAGTFVLKWNPQAPAGLFGSEADGLAALAASGTSLIVPAVIAFDDGPPAFLVIEDLGSGAPSQDFDELLGLGLAELHRAGGPRYGWSRDNYCGATPQSNTWTDRWVSFYRDHRLAGQVRRAADAGLLDPDDQQRLDRILARLDAWLDEPVSGPSLIHGDLWAGNVQAAAGGRPALLDPAVSCAHREAELGMMTLFGGFSARIFAAYEAAFPLESGWRDRNGLYQLYHLLNHLNLFGRGYAGDVRAVARRYA